MTLFTARRSAALAAAVSAGVVAALSALPSGAGADPQPVQPPPPRAAWVNPDGTVDMSKAHRIGIDPNAPASLRNKFPGGYVDLSTVDAVRGDAPGSPQHP